MTVFTIGYEGISIDAFMSLLAEHEVVTLVDIRELPLSRKPGFSKKALANVLKTSGREYVHLVELGCPKPIRDQYRADGNWKRYTKGFMKYLKTQDNTIAQLSSLVASANCALLCYEADANYCHRSMVADAVKEHCGARVTHIKATAKTRSLVVSHQPAYA